MNSLPSKQSMSISGFTLIELMVTIAVVAIIVSIAAPAMGTQFANQRVKSTTATLDNALSEAKAESVIRRQDVTLSFDNTSTPRVITISGSDGDASTIASYNYDDQITLTSTPTDSVTITFEPSKRVDATVTYTICDDNTSATPKQVAVSKTAIITNQTGGSCS